MKSFPVAVATLATVIAVGSWVSLRGQQPAQPQLPGSVLGARGEQVFPAFEGWGPVGDGSNAILIGYSNRNREQVLDIPVGPNNRIEPGGPDMGQPTHFETGRHWGVFALNVPKDFGNKKYTWTLVSNGQTTQVQFSLNPPYWIDFFKNSATGNTPPVLRLTQNGPELVGPPKGYAQTLNGTVDQPVTLQAWVSDKPNTYDPEEGLPENLRSRGRGGRGAAGTGTAAAGRGAAPAAGADANGANAAAGNGGGNAGRARGGAPQPNFDISGAQASGGGRGGGRGRGAGGPQPDATVTWKVHRGATGTVKIAEETQRLFNRGDINAIMEAKTTATFSKAGEYVIRAQINDASGDGGGGDQCCWTNALIKVNIK